MPILAWNTLPAPAELARVIEIHPTPLHLITCLSENRIPDFPLSDAPTELEGRLKTRLDQTVKCLQFNSVNFLENLLPNVHLWLVPPHCADSLHEHFDRIEWQTEAVPQAAPKPVKPWFRRPQSTTPPEHALVIGAGIAGAATARKLAEHGVRVTVLEAGKAAQGGSGNRQGLLYAKISPHDTEQTELLLAGYGYTRRLLQDLLPDSDTWGGDGLLHLNFDEAERKRNQALGLQQHHTHLYRSVPADEAAQIAGIDVFSDGLYWPQGVWLNPPAVVRALLNHPLIALHEDTPLSSAEYDGANWTANTPRGSFNASHIIYCMGAHSPNAADANVSALPFRQIRGQTGVAAASGFSKRLRCALSGESYISPSWRGQHCYGATFVLNSNDDAWHPHEETVNRAALQQLNPPLTQSLFEQNPPRSISDDLSAPPQGHAALRCDSPDHLPVVGALGDIAAMQTAYAKLALDKNYRLDNVPCPYLPNAYINTAHGTRGLATAPVCAAAIAADILGLPQPLSQRLRTALHPNRAVIRAIVRQQPLL
ncbi:FAD-dependent 5-carboxymethylaminomethyl-2-thiouridine(34) oxidoreductase MnmC [Neisseria sp. LNP16475]